MAPSLRSRIEAFLPPDVIFDRQIDRIALASDASIYRLIPRAVLRPRTVDQVRSIFRLSRETNLPVTFRAGGTSLSGQAVTDGLLVDLSRDWRELEVLDSGARVRVEPGVIGGRVNQVLTAFGRKLGPDPASINACMMGGILSNNSSGMCCGVSQNSYHTLDSLTFVLPSGTTIDTADPDAAARFRAEEPTLANGLLELRARILSSDPLTRRIRAKYRTKNTTGYSLNAFLDFEEPVEIFRHLLIGAEGTLAFIAEGVLRTVPDLPLKYTGLLMFATIREACAAIGPLAAAGAAALEVMDRASIRSVEGQPGMPPEIAGLPAEAAAILAEFQQVAGSDPLVAEVAAANATAGLPLIRPARFTRDPLEQALMWRVRKGMFPSVGAVRKSGTSVIIEDVTFPIARLADAVVDLTALFRLHDYDEAIIFGHAKDGNLHFVITQGFGNEEEISRYGRFMKDVVDLVLTRYDGALKAEHGTGRNMAPFVEAEWGPEAYAIMLELKRLADPGGLLNPGVILNSDPRAHLADLKSLPSVEPEVDKCIEYGFCEPKCPSRDLTTTPRQRIVIRREIERLRETGDEPENLAALELDFPYEVLDTCAADGLCATACPVAIDTGTLTKRFRSVRASSGSRRIAGWTAAHFALTQRLARAALRAGTLGRRLIGSGGMRAATRMLPAGAPRWIEPMPSAARALPHTIREGAVALYFPSCVTRTFGALPGEPESPTTAAALTRVAARAGFPIFIPDGIEDLCCGQPYASKGLTEAHQRITGSTIEKLWQASGEGSLPIVVDTTPCTWSFNDIHLLPPEMQALRARMKIVDAIEFFEPLLGALPIRKAVGTTIVHPVCSAEKLGLAPKLGRIAAACSERAIIPVSAGCCGFAGDRGWSVPELTAAATTMEAREVQAGQARRFISSSRTCEIGMTRATGDIYRSWIHLLDEATRA